MKRRFSAVCCWPLFALVSVTILSGAVLSGTVLSAAEKRPLDHDAYARWSALEDPTISSHGAWALYSLEPGDDGDGRLLVQSTASAESHEIERCTAGQFGWDEKWAACRVEPLRAEVLAAQIEGKKDDDLPKPGLALLDLASGSSEVFERVKSFAMPKKAGGYVAWLHEKEEVKGDDDGKQEQQAEEQAEEAAEATGEAEPSSEPEKSLEEPEKSTEEKARERLEKKKWDRKGDGTTLVLRDLASGQRRSFEHVTEYLFSEDGRWLAFLTNEKERPKDSEKSVDEENGAPTVTLEDPDGAFVISTAGAFATLPSEPIELLRGIGEYSQLAFDEPGNQLAFLSSAADWQSDAPAWLLYLWTAGSVSADKVVDSNSAGMPAGWAPSQHRKPEFSKSGGRLYFGTAPAPLPDPPEIAKDDRVVVDVWSWTDDLIQTQQLSQLEEEKKRSYEAVLHLGAESGRRLVQLASAEIPEIERPEDGESPFVLGVSRLPYRKMTSWDTQVYQDVFTIEVATGERRQVITRRRGNYRLSPGGSYAWWWDPELQAWFTLEVDAASKGKAEPVDVSSAAVQRFDDELHDSPSLPDSYGAAGWLTADAGLVLYDRYDLWLVDPKQPGSPTSVTDGAGRRDRVRYRLVDLDLEEPAIDPSQPLLLATFDETTKDEGFSRDRISPQTTESTAPNELILEAASFSTPIPASDSDQLIYRRGRFDQFDDLWVSDAGFLSPRRLSDANPQQSEYLWGSSELVHWTSLDGEPLDGILFKPEGFDPARKYPLITYFYERTSDNLNRYVTPIPHRSIIRFSFYTSRGYLVFAPDIPYQIGEPGPSALRAIVPGVVKLIEQGFVDKEAIGVQGHSWGGYQTAFLITQTGLFRAAVAGAVVSNMTSAYGGIRWESGMSRMFQYEKTQSRIGGTLWEELHRYLDNSPLFFADRITTPLLMMHNDQDGAVPWTQGIELFAALRRLDKPVWMLNYNGQPHWVITKANQIDYATRMQQFFDHYLKGAPAPRWMVEGVPAIEKGRTLGLELEEDESGA